MLANGGATCCKAHGEPSPDGKHLVEEGQQALKPARFLPSYRRNPIRAGNSSISCSPAACGWDDATICIPAAEPAIASDGMPDNAASSMKGPKGRA